MTEGEMRFYLREIHSHWSTSNVSVEKLNELKAARLIEMNGGPVLAVRLTSEGAHQKNVNRPSGNTGGLRLGGTPKPSFRPHRSRKAILPAKRLA